MLRRQIREIAVMHADARRRLSRRLSARARPRHRARGCAHRRAARGDRLCARSLARGLDVVALGGRYLVMRRTRAWRAFDALVGRRDPGRREAFLRRARQLGLDCTVTHRTRSRRCACGCALRDRVRGARAPRASVPATPSLAPRRCYLLGWISWHTPGTILLAILALGVLIIVHEGGHFLVARLSGMRVDRFSIGFGPKLFSFKRGKASARIFCSTSI